MILRIYHAMSDNGYYVNQSERIHKVGGRGVTPSDAVAGTPHKFFPKITGQEVL